MLFLKKKCNVMLKSVLGAFLLCQVKRSSPRDLLELISFAGACAGSVSSEVCLARGMLQGGEEVILLDLSSAARSQLLFGMLPWVLS